MQFRLPRCLTFHRGRGILPLKEGNIVPEMNDFVKLETHLHTSGVSLCGRLTPEEAIALYAGAGYRKVLLTNHYWDYHLEPLGATGKEKMQAFIGEYRKARTAGQALGVDVLLGAEIYIAIPDPETGMVKNSEYLTIGLTERLLQKSYPLCSLSQREFYDFCTAENLLMYQTHPFRVEHNVAFGDFIMMHGIEVYNGHKKFDPRTPEAMALAKKHSLKMLSGSDCHTADGVGRGGILVPDAIKTAEELRDFLQREQPALLSPESMIFP